MTVSSERQAAERAVSDYERQGYTVEREVNLATLDARLPSIRADFVARRGTELVIVEVKSRASARASSLAQLQSATELLPNARVDLVWAGEAEIAPEEAVAREYLKRADRVFEQDRAAGLLLAWAAVEGSVHRLVVEQNLTTDGPFTCRQGLSDLYGNRIISWSAYSKLMALSRTRNAVAHSQDVAVSRSDFEILRSYGRFLSSADFSPYEDALESARNTLSSAGPEDTSDPREWQRAWIARILPLMPKDDLDEILHEIYQS